MSNDDFDGMSPKQLLSELKVAVGAAKALYKHGDVAWRNQMIIRATGIMEVLSHKLNEYPLERGGHMAVLGRVSLDELPDEIRRRIVHIEGGEEQARAWMSRPNPGMHDREPAEALSDPEKMSLFWDQTSNVWVKEHLEAYLAEQARISS